ncbi:tRNA (5-methylaminomethyl-2-thiouridylate)-methyltransferase [Mucilaginibacter terrenus]|uniref:tRNA (5-methylaminomethyl-2-thiouridylate)-methyltransferase n=1 Tax=Mucilaginibacter terrenus TaxID=2482727 RepID=A0A3E2NX58_9SPHI|nr:tRNA (5-methylaminomethyl-2-thiouridine)(34)-methyltransferase MnmD [Mucilaginibacter terrenus]RFZ85598.1 tRNA (5-methylaminomethyl-2-thiouridylate)-methyltransferase [Mucilaginibacter terrenus]
MITPQNQEHLQIVSTEDGSKTIFNSLVGENYHSRHGAFQESQHVFLRSGLEYFLNKGEKVPAAVSVLEVGFGTGLNFLLSADFCANEAIALSYTGIEAYPLSLEMIADTGYNAYVSTQLWNEFLDKYQQSLVGKTPISDTCNLEVVCTELNAFNSANTYDVIYFDAFAAANQPEMWTDEAITHTLKFLKPGGVFVTYAITGNLKRCIKALGLKVEKAPGAPGKREMLRATYL